MSITKSLLTIFIDLLVRFYTMSLHKKLQYCHSVFYNHWIKQYIKHFGEKSSIGIDCQLQGSGQYISIGNDTHIAKHCILGCWKTYKDKHNCPKIIIGDNTNIGEYTQISAAKEVKIGNGVLTGRYVYISDNSHGSSDLCTLQTRPSERELYIKGSVIIGNNVWIGDKACILSGVTIGDGAIIGCNAVVTHDVSPYSIVAGVPAKIVNNN